MENPKEKNFFSCFLLGENKYENTSLKFCLDFVWISKRFHFVVNINRSAEKMYFLHRILTIFSPFFPRSIKHLLTYQNLFKMKWCFSLYKLYLRIMEGIAVRKIKSENRVHILGNSFASLSYKCSCERREICSSLRWLWIKLHNKLDTIALRGNQSERWKTLNTKLWRRQRKAH